MQITKKEAIKRVNELQLVKGIENFKFSYAVIKNKKKLEQAIDLELMQEALKPSEKYTEYNNKRIKLCEQYCKKDDDNEPIKIRNQYVGLLGNKEFLNAVEELQKEYQQVIDATEQKAKDYGKMIEDTIEFEPFYIDKTLMETEEELKKLSPEQTEAIFFMIK
ncbi:MAG: hypothetical protein KKB31_07600 [Nanoarchaeota archaeon]|nr:hypothetical protein [Nanoarchaeota archaeon]